MTQTLTTKQINAIASGEFDACSVLDASVSMARELLRYREAAETPSCWEIAGQLFTTKEEALKPGYVGTPEPLYDGPVLEANREAQPVAIVESSAYVTAAQIIGDEPPMKAVKELYEGALVIGQQLYTAPPAPAVPGLLSLHQSRPCAAGQRRAMSWAGTPAAPQCWLNLLARVTSCRMVGS